jgi:hypothetical protein
LSVKSKEAVVLGVKSPNFWKGKERGNKKEKNKRNEKRKVI